MNNLIKTVSNDARRSALSILRLPAVKARTGLSRSSIYAMMSEGDFPTQISLGKRAIGFVESEIDAWIFQRIETRQTKTKH
jgi:prophage regulatory protein